MVAAELDSIDTGAMKPICSEMPIICDARQPELELLPKPEPLCSHFTPCRVTLCSSSWPPACTRSRTLSPV
ncbi:hypothetical protein D3C80_1481200 [compost metagenome]